MAESPIITCPECHKKFKGKPGLEGKKIKCPLCAKPFVVAGEKTEEAIKMAPAPEPIKSAHTLGFADDEAEDDQNPYGMTYIDIAPRCPNCAQLMADEEAFICLFCGYNTLTREVGKTEKTFSHTAGERFHHLFPGLAVALVAFGFIVGLTYYCVVLPGVVANVRWAAMIFDSESLRMWFTIIGLSLIWGCGMYCYKRLIVNPTPAVKKKD
jgi:hypothetical protein